MDQTKSGFDDGFIARRFQQIKEENVMLSRSLRDLCGVEGIMYSRERRANNNSDNFHFSDYSLITSLDYIILNIFDPNDAYILFEVIDDYGFKVVSDQIINKGNYDRKRIYRNNDLSVEFLYKLKSDYSSLPPIRLYLRHPNQELILIISEIINNHRIEANTSVVEVSFDFYGKHLYNLMDFFHSHLFVRYQKSIPRRFKTTSYPEDCRSKVKGMRIYWKTDDGDRRFLRVELVLKRRVLKRMGLEFPLANIDEVNWLRFFNFQQLDVEALREYFIWLQREEIVEEAKKPKRGKGSFIVCHVDSAIDVLEEMSLVERVRFIRKSLHGRNYYRFLKPLDRINDQFIEMVTEKRFIPDQGAKGFIADKNELG
jgi:hypothetical protein